MDLRAFVGSSSTVHQLAQEEAKALFLADEEHKKNMKKSADGVADTADMKNHGVCWGISRRWWESQKEASHGKQNDNLCGKSTKSSICGTPRVEAFKL